MREFEYKASRTDRQKPSCRALILEAMHLHDSLECKHKERSGHWEHAAWNRKRNRYKNERILKNSHTNETPEGYRMAHRRAEYFHRVDVRPAFLDGVAGYL